MTTEKAHHTLQAEVQTIPKSRRVLIVDDEPAICFAYRKLLESEQFGVDLCESIDAAMALLHMNEYFAVISDVRFTGSGNEDGVHFVSVVRKEQPQAKVILVTGYGNVELEKTARELGASHYFEKPIMPSVILSLLRALHLVADENEENECFKNLLLAKTLVQ